MYCFETKEQWTTICRSRRDNGFGFGRGFVKKSAILSLVLTYLIASSLFCACSRMKWYNVSLLRLLWGLWKVRSQFFYRRTWSWVFLWSPIGSLWKNAFLSRFVRRNVPDEQIHAFQSFVLWVVHICFSVWRIKCTDATYIWWEGDSNSRPRRDQIRKYLSLAP